MRKKSLEKNETFGNYPTFKNKMFQKIFFGESHMRNFKMTILKTIFKTTLS